MQKATVADSIYIFDNSPCDERWMMKLQDLQTIQTCHCQRMSKTWHHDMHQALAPSERIQLHSKSMFVTDLLILSASAKAWKRRQSKAGVFIQGSIVQIVITEIRRTHDI